MSERKSLSEYAAEVNQPWTCPSCGCKDLRGEDNSRVESTRHPDGSHSTRRKRICRHCGQGGIVTDEVYAPPGYVIRVVREDEDERAVA